VPLNNEILPWILAIWHKPAVARQAFTEDLTWARRRETAFWIAATAVQCRRNLERPLKPQR